jgi:hypothetical protein
VCLYEFVSPQRAFCDENIFKYECIFSSWPFCLNFWEKAIFLIKIFIFSIKIKVEMEDDDDDDDVKEIFTYVFII